MQLSRRSKVPMGVRSRSAVLDVGSTQLLTGTYSDDTVESMAQEDGQARLFTDEYGEANREPRAINAINRGAEVSSALVSHELHGALAPLDEELERLKQLVPVAEHTVLRAIDEVEVAEVDRESIADACRADEVGLPDHYWLRAVGEGVALAILGVGDLYLTAKTFEVFGLSDRTFGFLPFNELQLVASSTVVALLLLARIAGHNIRIVGHLAEAPGASPTR